MIVINRSPEFEHQPTNVCIHISYLLVDSNKLLYYGKLMQDKSWII